MATVQKALGGLGHEVRTGRLVVIDDHGDAVLTAECVGGTTELRVEIPSGSVGRSTAAVLYAGDPARAQERAGVPCELGPAVGLQVWADGDAVAELDAWPGTDGRWRARLHLDAGP